MGFQLPRLYAIIDPRQSAGRSADEVCEALLAGGAKLIQYRDKQGSGRAIYQVALGLRERIQKAGGTFIVNDRADIARAARADGVHVGQDDLPVDWARRVVGTEKIIGYSTHNLDQLRAADGSSADYLAYGPIYPTRSKERADPVVGLEGLREARRATAKPLVAIGGITVTNARAVLQAGADAVAVISDLIGAPDISVRTREFLQVLEEI